MFIFVSRASALCALASFAAASSAFADTLVTPSTEYRDRIKVSQTVQPTGDTPFGENVNLYKGGLSFTQTAISHPGTGGRWGRGALLYRP